MSSIAASSLARYSALVGATFAGATTASAVVVFNAPYSTSDLPTSMSYPLDNSTLGAWTWDEGPTENFIGIRALNAGSLLIQNINNSNTSALTVDFKTTIVAGFETISFSYDITGFGLGSVQWFKNSEFNTITGSGAVSDAIFAPGDVFGFRVSATYAGGSGGASFLTLSNLTATAIPEPASAGSWIGLGVAGLVAMRELRRRPRAAATSA
ncbi:MAG: hypothetical protein MUE42_10850 [Opitutaceae bacterium]|jgi:hypothetical protein|nr:hypothetical protein [Opitutaceae bacterium]